MKEIWKPIVGYEGLYEVSNLGRVKIVERTRKNGKTYKEKIMRADSKDKYSQVSLYRDGKASHHLVHRLVAEAFIPNPNNLPQVNHKDEDKNNNTAENLEWCTAKYNCNYGTRMQRLRHIAKNRSVTNGGTCGVCFDKSKGNYMSYIGVNNKTVWLGRYDTEKEAIASRQGAEILLCSLGME